MISVYNFSHRIDQLSFGSHVPGYVYPLDGDLMIAQKSECIALLSNRLFAGGGHVTTATLNLSAMTKWYLEMERAS